MGGLADSLARENFDLKMSVIDAGSGNIFKRIIDYSNKNPWLYAVYVVLVGLPTVLIITFCCTGSAKNEGDKSSLNDPKKTDAHQEDDEAEEEQEEEEGEGEANDGSNAEDGNDEEETEEEEIDEPPTTRSQTRKRRPRKDN